jgi:hypothetical protein
MRSIARTGPARMVATTGTALVLSLLLCAVELAPGAAAQNVFGGANSPATGAAKPATTTGKGTTSPKIKVTQGGTAVKTAPAPNVKVTPAGKAAATATTATTATTTTETSGGVNSSLVAALVIAVLLLGGIAFVIVRNARSVAPVVEGFVTGGSRNPEGKLRKRRAQAKAAKQQRKRHRK